MLSEAVAIVCLIWYVAVVLVCAVGILQLYRWYSIPPSSSISSAKGNDAPHVTIIRPIKGVDAYLYDCLASTFHQDYPLNRLTVHFCVDSEDDLAVPIVKRLIAEFPDFDARLYIETDDPVLRQIGKVLGPNPKIRSMSRPYREAKGDLIWIIDCNVWVNKSTCGRMVDTLCGYGQRGNKFVHQLPIVTDQTSLQAKSEHGTASRKIWSLAGGRFEEAWFSAAHAKFYTAINTVLIAPCIVGKSNMFRKSHLDALTNGQGIDFFSHNICEDHLIGDLLWKQPIPPSILQAAQQDSAVSQAPWGNHAMDFGNPVFQPVRSMSVPEFFHRRVRWLRVRKFTVIAATLVEPGTESILCSLYGAYAISSLSYLQQAWHIPSTWFTFFAFFVLSMICWSLVDWTLYCHLQSGASINADPITPNFVQFQRRKRRTYKTWLAAWLGRELLAFPIWAWAVYGGVKVNWRGKLFRVGIDMKVSKIGGGETSSTAIMDDVVKIE